MILDSHDRFFARDTVEASFDVPEATTDADDGDDKIDWSEVTVVEIDQAPYEAAFDTDRFYKIPTVAARPIPQEYHTDEGTVTLKKPGEELAEGAWSLDRDPVPLTHPSTGTVRSLDQVHGFTRQPEYDADAEELRTTTYIPVNDDEAQSFVARDNTDVSVGFYNTVDVVEDSDADVDGYQRDLFFDHLAIVGTGRCSSEDGCGLDLDDDTDVVNVLAPESDVMPSLDADVDGVTHDAPEGIYVADGTWFAVGPDDHTKESTKYAGNGMFPVDSCSDVDDAWTLKGHTENLTIEQSTLADRIERAAEAMDCDVGVTDDDAATVVERYDPGFDIDVSDTTTTMTTFDIDTAEYDIDCDCLAEDDLEQIVADLDADNVAEVNEDVASVIEERDELQATVDEYEKRDLVDDILDLTDAWDEAELMECDTETLEVRLEDAEAMASEPGVNTDNGTDDGGDDGGVRSTRRGLDLSDNV